MSFYNEVGNLENTWYRNDFLDKVDCNFINLIQDGGQKVPLPPVFPLKVKNEVMVTSLIEMLELATFGLMTTSTI